MTAMKEDDTFELTLWGNDGAERVGSHATVAGQGAALSGGNEA
jgi:hypothetical protein